MAPEQLFGSATVDARADVWSIGAIFYEMLTGRPPYDFPTLTRICAELAGRQSAAEPEAARPDLPDRARGRRHAVLRARSRAPRAERRGARGGAARRGRCAVRGAGAAEDRLDARPAGAQRVGDRERRHVAQHGELQGARDHRQHAGDVVVVGSSAARRPRDPSVRGDRGGGGSARAGGRFGGEAQDDSLRGDRRRDRHRDPHPGLLRRALARRREGAPSADEHARRAAASWPRARRPVDESRACRGRRYDEVYEHPPGSSDPRSHARARPARSLDRRRPPRRRDEVVHPRPPPAQNTAPPPPPTPAPPPPPAPTAKANPLEDRQ